MNEIPMYVWQFQEGRAHDGDKFRVHYLTHAGGRILAKVNGPLTHDEFIWRVVFNCKVPDEILDTSQDLHFIDEQSAMSFVDNVLAKFDPINESKPEKPRVAKTKRKQAKKV